MNNGTKILVCGLVTMFMLLPVGNAFENVERENKNICNIGCVDGGAFEVEKSVPERRVTSKSLLGVVPLLNESFEEPWVNDSDGNLAPPGWEVIKCSSMSGFRPAYWNRDCEVPADDPIIPVDGEYQAGVWWNFEMEQDEWLITPEIDLTDISGNVTLQFWSYHYGNLDGTYVLTDHHSILISTDGGDAWEEIIDLVDGHSNHYEQAVILNLSNYTGEIINIAWRSWWDISEPQEQHGCWYIDYIRVLATSDVEIKDVRFKGFSIITTLEETIGDVYAEDVVVTVTIQNLFFNRTITKKTLPVTIPAGETVEVEIVWRGFGHYNITTSALGYDYVSKDVWWFLLFGFIK